MGGVMQAMTSTLWFGGDELNESPYGRSLILFGLSCADSGPWFGMPVGGPQFLWLFDDIAEWLDDWCRCRAAPGGQFRRICRIDLRGWKYGGASKSPVKFNW